MIGRFAEVTMLTTESAPSTPRAQDMLSYQHPDLVKRLGRKLKLAPEEAEELFVDLKRFLLACVVAPGPHTPDARIDAAWHEFILFTRDYARFCTEFAGRFIHHRPLPEAERRTRAVCDDDECTNRCAGDVRTVSDECESCTHPACDDDVRIA